MKSKIKIGSFLLLLCTSVFILCACDKGASHTHQYGEWKETKAATCTEAGEESRYCSCGDTQTRIISIKGHSYGEWTVTKAVTCIKAGEESRCCSCGDTQKSIILPKGHSYGEWIVTKVATCTEKGTKEGVCSSCGDKQTQQIPATGHSYGNWVISKEATCAQAGEKYAICSVCNDKKTEIISKYLTHTYDAGTITKSPTCTAGGSKTFTCTVCKTTKEEALSPLGHSLDQNGKCSRCGLVTLNMTSAEIEKSKKIKKMGHSVYEYSSEVHICINLKDDNSYYVQVPVYVDIKIVDNVGNTLYSKTLVKKSSQDEVVIDYDEITNAVTNTGTLYYTVYNDYVSFDTYSKELEEIPWTVTIELPNVPQTISRTGYYWGSSCKVTKITYKVSDDDVSFYFTGEKTYDVKGNNYSQSCYIGWKLYDEDGYVVADGTCYTTSIKVGEKFKDADCTAYNVIEQGKTYRLVIMDVS